MLLVEIILVFIFIVLIFTPLIKQKRENRYIQVGGTCAIFAILNGKRKYESKTCLFGRREAFSLWRKAIDGGYSKTGEFYNTSKLVSFINNCVDDYEADTSDIEEISESIKNSSFVLLPIIGNNTKFGQNMHWVCIKGGNIINSQYDKKEENISTYLCKYNILIHSIDSGGCYFQLSKWCEENSKSIKNIIQFLGFFEYKWLFEYIKILKKTSKENYVEHFDDPFKLICVKKSK